MLKQINDFEKYYDFFRVISIRWYGAFLCPRLLQKDLLASRNYGVQSIEYWTKTIFEYSNYLKK